MHERDDDDSRVVPLNTARGPRIEIAVHVPALVPADQLEQAPNPIRLENGAAEAPHAGVEKMDRRNLIEQILVVLRRSGAEESQELVQVPGEGGNCCLWVGLVR